MPLFFPILRVEILDEADRVLEDRFVVQITGVFRGTELLVVPQTRREVSLEAAQQNVGEDAMAIGGQVVKILL